MEGQKFETKLAAPNFNAVLDELRDNASHDNEREPFSVIGNALRGFTKEQQQQIAPMIAALNIPKVSAHLLRYGSILSAEARQTCVMTVVAHNDPFDALEARKTVGLEEEQIKALDTVIQASQEPWPKAILKQIEKGDLFKYKEGSIQ